MPRGADDRYWQEQGLPSVFKHTLLDKYVPQFAGITQRGCGRWPAARSAPSSPTTARCLGWRSAPIGGCLPRPAPTGRRGCGRWCGDHWLDQHKASVFSVSRRSRSRAAARVVRLTCMPAHWPRLESIRLTQSSLQGIAALTLTRDLGNLRLAQRPGAHSSRLPGVALAPLGGSGAARPSGALRAIDSTACPRSGGPAVRAACGGISPVVVATHGGTRRSRSSSVAQPTPQRGYCG